MLFGAEIWCPAVLHSLKLLYNVQQPQCSQLLDVAFPKGHIDIRSSSLMLMLQHAVDGNKL